MASDQRGASLTHSEMQMLRFLLKTTSSPDLSLPHFLLFLYCNRFLSLYFYPAGWVSLGAQISFFPNPPQGRT